MEGTISDTVATASTNLEERHTKKKYNNRKNGIQKFKTRTKKKVDALNTRQKRYQKHINDGSFI